MQDLSIGVDGTGASPRLAYWSDADTVTSNSGLTFNGTDLVAPVLKPAAALGEVYGGTGQSTYTLGDIIYSSASNVLSKLAGNVTTTKKFLRQTGNGAVSAAPAWDTLVSSDLPATGDINARVAVNKNSGATVGTRRRINFIEGTNVTLTVADDSGNEEVDVTITAASGGMSIGGTVTSGTAGRILFVATGPVLDDDAGLQWDDTAKTLKLTGTGAEQLHLYYDVSNHVKITASSAGKMVIEATGFEISVTGNRTGDNVYFGCYNTNNANASSGAAFFLSAGGTSAGDAYIYYEVLGSTNWCCGLDNSDSDSFKISKNPVLGTNDYLVITTAGLVTLAGSLIANGSNGAVFAQASNGTSPQLGLRNAAGTLHWELYETLGAAGQQGDLHLYDGVGATDRMSITTTGYLSFPVVRLGFFGTSPSAQAGAYTVTNRTIDRSYDCNATTVDELADVLGTVILELQAYGLLA